MNKRERVLRLVEEATEVAQALGIPESDIHGQVRHTYSRPVGELLDEIGGTIVTLSALCSACDISLEDAAEKQLKKCWERIDVIREKQKVKPLQGDYT
jgi:NTP pyrophosphatase (non-canonical NTP hydrolase)